MDTDRLATRHDYSEWTDIVRLARHIEGLRIRLQSVGTGWADAGVTNENLAAARAQLATLYPHPDDKSLFMAALGSLLASTMPDDMNEDQCERGL